MNDDMVVFPAHDSNDFLSRDETPLIIRENGDFELRFYFNPARFKVEKNDIKPLVTRASLMARISRADLSRIKFGEIVVGLNPAISGEEAIEFVKKLFLDYFDNLSPVTL